VALRQEGDLDAAIASYRRALTHKPGYAAAHNNLAIALQERGDLGQAADHYRQAIALQPDLANAHANLGVLLLLQGQYATGWAEYGWRHAMADAGWGLHVRPHTPPWDGRSLQPGETLLLVCEQGLGDTLQFMRYAPHLRRQGIAVRLCAQPPLHGLIRASAIDPAPIAPAQVDPDRADPWLPLLSLPGILGVSAANPLVREPYLHPPPERLERWRQRLADESRPLVALTWQGNPVPERSTLRGRSLPLETFAPLAVACGGTFLSLQKGFGAEQLESCSFRDRFARCQDEVSATWDFLDAAAILACCDLVISSDTALAHLAGGLGLPTWLLLRDLPDWRWGLEGDASFWYPSLRLFRQRRRGDWDEVIDRVAGALGALPERKPAPDPGEPARRGEPILAPISLGELIDKITILEIKEERLQGPALAHVRQELAALRNSLATLDLRVEARRIEALRRINAQLWDIEDAIREHERRQDFGDSFVQLARSVYQQNDRRAAIKREINTAYGSALIEEKSYSDYGADPLDKGGEPAQVQYELGCALLAQGDVEAAVAALERALALRPEFPEAHLDLGNARQAQGLLPAAMACFRAAERQRPAYAEARLNLALAQLLSGDYAAGLENYEWRFRTHGSALLVAVPELEPWRGEPLPAGESLLLVAEQGLGDTLQFMRYALPLRERGLAVRLCAPARLHGLIRASGIDPDPLTAERIGSLRSGRWLPLLSLPGQLGVRPDRPLRSEPYLRTDPILREKWRGILAGEGQPVIGLHWQGNPAQEHNHGRGRSLPLEAFAPLAGIEGIRLLSLQKGSGSEQLAACSFRDRFVSCQPAVDEIWDFEETAAIVAACDLVITSDSALAHLAGGLGHPTWLLLKDVPEWRWGLEGETSFWYPSLRLFRQRQRGDWAAVLARVADELAALLALQALLAPPPLMGGGPL
jgi:tetratricopeptide (TPR) repeat protein